MFPGNPALSIGPVQPMRRRTPLLALLLAPLVLLLAAAAWQKLIAPAAHRVRLSDPVLEWRLNRADPQTRAAALQAIASRAESTQLTAMVVALAASDPVVSVRTAAIATLGQIGARRSIGDAGTAVLVATAREPADDVMLQTAVTALGRAAGLNPVDEATIERIARLFAEPHAPWLDQPAAIAIGHIGAAQSLPENVLLLLNRTFAQPLRRGQRGALALTFRAIAESRRLPVATLDRIAAAVRDPALHPSAKISLLYALAYDANVYLPARAALEQAARDTRRDVAEAAQHGLRIVEGQRLFGDTTPLAIARDRQRSRDERLRALDVIRGLGVTPPDDAAVVALSADPDPAVGAAALGLFRQLARRPDNAFDEATLIPALQVALRHPDADVRVAAHGALSSIGTRVPQYWQVNALAQQLAAAIHDPEPRVRQIALASKIRTSSNAAAVDDVLDQALADPAASVRANAVSWLASDRIRSGRRDALFDRALTDPDPAVQAAAQAARARWQSRERTWPVQLWRELRAGRYGNVLAAGFIVVTLAVPAILALTFPVYVVARGLTQAHERRWRALAAIPVLAVWGGASWAFFMLLFMLAHAGDSPGTVAKSAAIVWAASAAYAVLAWVLHFAVRGAASSRAG